MFKTIKTLIAVAALSGTVSANVQAKEVMIQKGDTSWELSQVHNASVENIKKWNYLSTDLLHPMDILNIATKKHYTVKQEDTLLNSVMDNHISVPAKFERNQLYTNLIHPGLNLVIYDDAITPSIIKPTKVDSKSTESKTDATPAATQSSVSARPTEVSSAPAPGPAPGTAPAPGPAPVKPDNEQAEAPKPENNPQAVPAPEPVPTPEPAATSVPTPAPAPDAAQSEAPKEITVKATAYTASCEGCSGITKTGVNLNENPEEKVIAVDPSVIPLGTKVFVEGYGEATAADTGGAIKGNRIDVYMQNESDAIQFGAKELTVKILN